MTCGAHTASQPWRRHRRARDTCPETPDINRATSRAPRALSCTYTFDPVQWVDTCKRNRPEPTKHAPAMPMARVPVSLVRVYLLHRERRFRLAPAARWPVGLRTDRWTDAIPFLKHAGQAHGKQAEPASSEESLASPRHASK